jgi:hypothetical protein
MRFIYLVTLLLSGVFLNLCKHENGNGENNSPNPLPVDTLTNIIPDIGTLPDTIVDNIPDTVYYPEPVVPVVLNHIELARLNIGVPPRDSIKKWMNFVGFTERDPFCAGAQSWWLHKAEAKSPRIRTALARDFVFKSDPRDIVLAEKVLRGEIEMPAGSLVVYQNGDTRFGHVGSLTQPMRGARGVYISANTSAPGGTNIASGGGVYEKDFMIIPGAKLRVREFVYTHY